MSYCDGRKSVKVNYSFNKAKNVFTFKKAPIDIEKSSTKTVDPNKSCWRFRGKGVNNNDNYEFYACGNNPEFRINVGGNYNLFMDGVMLQNGSYEYRSGSTSISKVDKVVSNPGYNSSGDCNSCSIDKCKLTVKFQGQTIFEKTGDCPVDFEVACDDDCPPGHIKCTHNKYPGYCCIPCKNTASKINNLANKIDK